MVPFKNEVYKSIYKVQEKKNEFISLFTKAADRFVNI